MYFLWVLALVAYAGVPVALVLGWVKWLRRPKEVGTFALFSLFGFGIATSSAALAIYVLVYSIFIGGFPFYDPLLLRFYRWGFGVSVLALLFSFLGVWRKSVLRWYAPALSCGMCLAWFIWAIGE